MYTKGRNQIWIIKKVRTAGSINKSVFPYQNYRLHLFFISCDLLTERELDLWGKQFYNNMGNIYGIYISLSPERSDQMSKMVSTLKTEGLLGDSSPWVSSIFACLQAEAPTVFVLDYLFKNVYILERVEK